MLSRGGGGGGFFDLRGIKRFYLHPRFQTLGFDGTQTRDFA